MVFVDARLGPDIPGATQLDRPGFGLVMSLISSCELSICPPVGKSGPFTQRHSCAVLSSSLSSSLTSAVQISARLCGGMLVAMPTAIPVAPLTGRLATALAAPPARSWRRCSWAGSCTVDSPISDQHLVADAGEPGTRCSASPTVRRRRRAIRSCRSRRPAGSAARTAAPRAPGFRSRAESPCGW